MSGPNTSIGTWRCKRCQHRFAPVSPACDVIDPTTLPEVPNAPLADEKVAVECPGCRQALKVRPRYLGSVVVCTRCDRQFIASAGSDGGAAQGPGLALGSEIERLAERLGGVEASLEGLRSEEPRPDEGLERASAELEQQRRGIAALEASLSAVRGDFEEFRAKAGSDWEAERQAFAGEVLAGLEGERDLARQLLEQREVEVEQLRRQNAELASLGAEAETRSMALASRLDFLEEAARLGLEQQDRLGERLRTLEDAEAERAALREQFEQLRDQNDAILEKSEAVSLQAKEGIEGLHERLRLVSDQQAERQGRLEETLARLDALESEKTSLRGELEHLRRELDATRKDRTVPSPDPAASKDVGTDSVEVISPPTAPVIGLNSVPTLFNLDRLAQDLLLDQLGRTDDRSRPESPETRVAAPPGMSAVAGPSSPTPKPITTDVAAEYNRLGQQFNLLRNQGNSAQAIATARRIVVYTSDHFGDRHIEHALWLRNLGMSLLNAGERAEARALILRALEISKANLNLDQLPYAICLIDLADVHLAEGDGRRARPFCQDGLAIMKTLNLANDHPLLMRAQGCMARIEVRNASFSVINTMSITT